MEPGTQGEYRPGDHGDFDRLYRACYPRLLRTVYAVLGDAAAAEDCLQDAFVRAFRAWPRFRPERPAEAWVYQIAINTAISHRRRQRLREVGEVVRRLGRPRPGPDPAETATRPDVVAALASLKPRVAADFVLRFLYGFSIREIATMEGISERAVRLRLAQARDQLAKRLGDAWRGELPVSEGQSVVIP
jgi:RNA polymerase sigma-70 factor (ECF subfamily)